MSTHILLADDDPVQCRLTEAALKRLGMEVTILNEGDTALEHLTNPDSTYDAAIIDLVMPGLDGMGILQRLRETETRIPVLVQTSQGSIDSVINAMRLGATDFLVKPVSPERLHVSLNNALKVKALEAEVKTFRDQGKGTLHFRDLVSSSPDMMQAVKLGERAASSHIPVLLEGESGVGKEVFARALQGAGDRAQKPFVAVNCGALPLHLIESLLFGHEKGAFTGATERHNGKFLEADTGTLFLDEVGELPLEAQTRLLRVLQDGVVDAVGGKKPVKVDVRIISATNRDLLQLVREGKFREDLYYRLAVFPITLPPLRRRKGDIPSLARRFVARFAAQENKTLRGLTPEAVHNLMDYDWPGNVRQLENVIFRAVVMADNHEILATDLPPLGTDQEKVALKIGSTTEKYQQNEALNEQTTETLRYRLSIPLLNEDGHSRTLADIEAQALRMALQHYDNRMSEIARRLGIGRSTLYRKLEDLGLNIEDAA